MDYKLFTDELPEFNKWIVVHDTEYNTYYAVMFTKVSDNDGIPL